MHFLENIIAVADGGSSIGDFRTPGIDASGTRLHITSATLSYVPPHPPWQELNSLSEAGGYLSIYYSDDLSRLPVRWVTKPGDNKSDPNLETLTYGLFSTCAPRMRSGVVARRGAYLFFVTSRKGTRVLTGYYHLRWYTSGVFVGTRDFCLAADTARFIEEPIPLAEVDRCCQTDVAGWFRGMRLLSARECRKIAMLIDARPDATAAYLEEIDRLERFTLRHGGYRYIARRQMEKFSWALAKDFLEKPHPPTLPVARRNSSPSGLWKCLGCSESVKNKALLKRCPHCGALGTLMPA